MHYELSISSSRRLHAARSVSALLAAVVVCSVAARAQSPTPGFLFDDLRRAPSELGSSPMKDVVQGDLDGDGDLDLVFVGGTGYPGYAGFRQVFLNNGGGIFTPGDFVFGGAETLAAALGDVDGDGDLDLVCANRAGAGAQNRLHLNDGSGVFTDATAGHLPAASDFSASVVLGDVDGDGDLDVLFGNGGPQSRLCLNDGSGVFVEATSQLPAAVGTSNRFVRFGDVDGDGDLDVVVGVTGERNRLWLNVGGGFFIDVTAQRMPATVGETQSIALGDVDGDGDIDIVEGNSTLVAGQQNRLYVNDGAGTFTDVTAAQMAASLDSTFAIELADVDGDGDLDLLAGNGWPAVQNVLCLNDGAGNFSLAAGLLPVDTSRTHGARFGDMDGDGDLDLVCANEGTDKLFKNDGTGHFSDALSPGAPQWDHVVAVAHGDVDGDGDIDLMLARGPAARDQLLLNDGTGRLMLAPAAQMPTTVADSRCAALGDVDGDGDLDVVVGVWSQPDLLYLNDGVGNFTDASSTQMPVLAQFTTSVALADLDGDGDLDLVFGNDGNRNRLYLNDGAGLFTDGTVGRLPAIVDPTRAVALGDVDGDGDLDLAVANWLAPNQLLLNDGLGAFTLQATSPVGVGALPNTDAVFADYDGDGELDLLIASSGGESLLYLNDGSGGMVDAGPGRFNVTADSRSLAVGDVDADGDVDVMLGNHGYSGSPERDFLLLNDGAGSFSEWFAGKTNFLEQTTDVELVDLDGDGDLDLVSVNGDVRVQVNLSRQLNAPQDAVIGTSYTLDAYFRHLGASTADVAFVNLSTSWLSTPVSLPPLGTLRILPMLWLPVLPIPTTGKVSTSWAVPNLPAIVGLDIYAQAAIGAWPSDLRLSNATADVVLH